MLIQRTSHDLSDVDRKQISYRVADGVNNVGEMISARRISAEHEASEETQSGRGRLRHRL